MELWGYYRILRRWRWVIVAGMIAGVIGGLMFYRPGLNDYSATATLLVPSPNNAAYSAPGLNGGAAAGSRGLQVLGEIWSSQLADQVIRDMHLNETVYQFHLRLDAVLDRVSPLARITVSGRTPREAIALANAVASAVAQNDRDAGQRDYTVARELVERQLATAQAKMASVQADLLQFERANQADLSSPAASEVTNLQTQMQNNDVLLSETRARLAATTAQLEQQGPTHKIPDPVVSAQIDSIRNDIMRAEIGLTSELAYHTENYPHVIALKTQIEGLKAQLNTALSRDANIETVVHNPLYDSLTTAKVNLSTEMIALTAKRDALLQVIGDTSSRLPVIAAKRSQLDGYTREMTDLGRTIQTLTQQVTDARLREQAAQAQAGVSVVDRAQTAQPNPFRAERFILMFALVLGLLLGVGMAALFEYLDNTLRTPQRAERVLGVPALAAIPTHNPPFSEAYRMLRVTLMAASGDKPEIFAVTGTKPGVGTSTVVANTAKAFAQAGRRTIIVDAAVDRPVQHTLFGVRNETGLADVLDGRATLAQALAPTGLRNLALLPAGDALGEDRESSDGRFASPAMRTLLASLQERADVILFDTSPASMFSSTLDLAPIVSGVILAVDAHQVPRGVEQQTKLQLARVGATLLGFVLTKVRPDLVDSYYYHDRQLRPQREGLSPAVAGTAMLVLIAAAGALGVMLFRHAGLHLHLPAFGQVMPQWASLLRLVALRHPGGHGF
jgi:succinoglycan biosynthesis transport protein ExoP